MNIFRLKENDIQPKRFETHIFTADGKMSRVLAGEQSRRIYVPLKLMPKHLIDAITVIEDKNFFSHHGIDVQGLMRSTAIDIFTFGKKIQGGSTITQQLIKNTLFPNWYNEHDIKSKIKRKIKEILLAIRIERMVSKEKIIENYLNFINLGNGRYGVQTAAQLYFNKNVWELSLDECAILAAIPKGPAIYNPISNLKRCRERRNLVLYKMYTYHLISKKEYIKAKKSEITVYTPVEKNPVLDITIPSSYFEDALINQVASDLSEKQHITKNKAFEKLYSGGLRIKSTEDSNIQRFSESIFSSSKFIPDLDLVNGPEAAMILMDSTNGHILATVGGRGRKEQSLLFNRAIDAKRKIDDETTLGFFERTSYNIENKTSISLIDICLAYANFESKGLSKNGFFYEEVYDFKRHKLLDSKEASSPKNKQSSEYSSSSVINIHHSLQPFIEIHYEKDIWVVGRIGKLVLGVWGGYDNNKSIPRREKYYTYPRRIFKEIASYIEKEQAYERKSKDN